MRNQAADTPEEAVEIGGNPARRIVAGAADVMGEVGLAIGDGGDVAIDLVDPAVVAEKMPMGLSPCIF
jgi:hypothetical protein